MHSSNLCANTLLALVACVILAWGNGPANWSDAGTRTSGDRAVPVVLGGGDELRADEPESRFFYVETRTIAPPAALERVIRDYDRGRTAVHAGGTASQLRFLKHPASGCAAFDTAECAPAALYKLNASYRL